jgi:hypothetical protein
MRLLATGPFVVEPIHSTTHAAIGPWIQTLLVLWIGDGASWKDPEVAKTDVASTWAGAFVSPGLYVFTPASPSTQRLALNRHGLQGFEKVQGGSGIPWFNSSYTMI